MHVQELVRYDALPMHDFAEIVAANSTAFLDVTGAVIGNPTEGALLEWLHAQGEDYEPLRAGAKIVDRLTFSTERKYMATIIQSGISGRRIVCVKGRLCKIAETHQTEVCPENARGKIEKKTAGTDCQFLRHDEARRL